MLRLFLSRSRSLARRPSQVAALLVLLPALVAAQDFSPFTAIFKSISSISIYGQAAVTGRTQTIAPGTEARYDAIPGMGAEVYLSLPSPEDSRWSYELGLGTSFIRGSAIGPDGLDLRLSARAFPTIAIYAAYDAFTVGEIDVGPYVAGNFGFIDLWNAQAYGPNLDRFEVDGQTYDIGGGLGLSFSTGPLVAFAEMTYFDRRLGAIQYEGEDLIPDSWPRSLDLSSWVMLFGVQANLKAEFDEEEPAPPPSIAGLYLLDRVDGVAVPAPWANAGRTHVMHGILELGGTGFYTLDLLLRDRADTTTPLALSGTYTGLGRVSFSGTDPFDGFVDGDELRLVLPGSPDRVLVFRLAD